MTSVFRQSRSLFSSAAIILLASVCLAQTNPQSTASTLSPEFKKYSAVFAAFGKILQKTREAVPEPLPRNHSRLLPLLPAATIIYAAVPNYGEASHQFLTIFRAELKSDPELRAWWQSRDMAADGPKIEDGLEKFYQLSQFLGDEVVISAANRGKEAPALLVLAEVQKPGLKEFLQQKVKDLAQSSNKSKSAFPRGPNQEPRILDAAELNAANDTPASGQPVILVLPNLVALTADITTARNFYSQLESNKQDFASTDFGQRLAKSYEGGVTAVAGIDLESILAQIPQNSPQSQAAFELTGFSSMKHLVWERKNLSGQPASQFELSFTGPRRGVASWLAASGPMQSLEFVSPKAVIAGTFLLKNPATIFDDIRNLATASNPNAFNSFMKMEDSLKINLRDDLLSRLGGELTFELDSVEPTPEWKVILKTDDPSGVLATLRRLLVATRMAPIETDEEGVTYHTIQIPSPQKTQEITYAVVDGYLIFGSGHQAIAEAVHAHRTGDSLAASRKFQAALPTGDLAQTSAILYEDPMTVAALTLKRVSPELADSLAKNGVGGEPMVMCGYGDESALREVSRSKGMNLGATLVVAAIAIPNLLRARMAANESSAVAMVRTVNTAQIMYASAYPGKGYARSLATLGPDLNEVHTPSPQHAAVIDSVLGGPTCTAGAWCIKAGYRVTVKATCQARQRCREYVVVATPVGTSTGTRNFCSTSDAVVRVQPGAPLASPVTAGQCREWTPLQ